MRVSRKYEERDGNDTRAPWMPVDLMSSQCFPSQPASELYFIKNPCFSTSKNFPGSKLASNSSIQGIPSAELLFCAQLEK